MSNRSEASLLKFQKVKELNDKLRHEELRLRRQYLDLKAQLNDLVRQQFMDDFNIEFLMMAFSDDDAFNKKNNVETGDPFCTSYCLTSSHFEDDESFFENWTEVGNSKTNAFSQLHICYAMHIILYDSSLDWEDILAIDDVWLEIKVDYQFWTKKVNDSPIPN